MNLVNKGAGYPRVSLMVQRRHGPSFQPRLDGTTGEPDHTTHIGRVLIQQAVIQ
jgi:hypothetical protein